MRTCENCGHKAKKLARVPVGLSTMLLCLFCLGDLRDNSQATFASLDAINEAKRIVLGSASFLQGILL